MLLAIYITKIRMASLIMAANNGHTETATTLINASAELNHANEKGMTALMIAAKNGHTDTATALLNAGADLNHVNEDGDTAFDLASDEALLAVIEAALLKRQKKQHRPIVSDTDNSMML